MMGERTPCQDCTERNSGCHATCPKYKAWQEKYLREKAAIEEANRAFRWTYARKRAFYATLKYDPYGSGIKKFPS